MCLAIPGKVLSVDGPTAVVERYGETLTVDLSMLPEPVAVGDYLVIRAQTFAVDKVDAAAAAEAYKLFDQILDAITPSGGTGSA